MLHNIPIPIKQRMSYLEDMDKRQRIEGMPSQSRLRQIPPETGRFLALLATMAPQGSYLEIGTSAGYSALWLSLACRELGRRLVTFEVSEEKTKLARETFRQAEVDDLIELIQGDIREYLDDYKNVSFCFLDAEKEIYAECYEKLIPNMIKGGILVADNVISHKEILDDMVKRALNDKRVDAMVVPIGRGELVCRKI